MKSNDSMMQAPIKTSSNKICTVAELGQIAAEARTVGRRVVLSHGVFDLLHFGHLRHLEAARQLGDVLLVTITADRHVNKGPGRPIFPAQVRAEMLAALGIVDGVAINEASLAVPVLEAVKPDVYVKGSDYAQPQDDVTGGISVEQRIVESFGGRLIFTDEVTYSSSSLINKYLSIYDPEVDEYLRVVRERGILDGLSEMIDKVKDFRVLVVGDTIVDDYHYVRPMAKAPKENLIATLYKDCEMFAGGVIAAANHVAAFCRDVDVLTALGGTDSHADLIRSRLKANVHLHAVTREGVPTTRKCRFIDQSSVRKLFEVYYMDETPIAPHIEDQLKKFIEKNSKDYDLVIVTDFGHGFVTPPLIEALARCARFLAVNAQTNSANYGYNLISRYPRADYVCIDAPEARLATRDKFSDIAQVVSEQMPSLLVCQKFIITHGPQGCVTFQNDDGAVHRSFHRIPAFTKTVVDTIGAGDAFLAVTSPLVAVGAPLDLVGFVGNAVGAMKVGIVGHRQSIEKTALLKFLTALLK